MDYKELFAPGNLPTVAEMRTLPMWATVALAAYWARRLQPTLSASWPEASAEHRAALDKAISIGEVLPREDPVRIINSATAALNATNELRPESGERAGRAYLAGNAALLTAYAVRCGLKGAVHNAAENAVDVVKSAALLDNTLIPEIRRDFDRLKSAAEGRGWDHETTEPLEFFDRRQDPDTAWRQVAIFVSSTFHDMHAERDELVRNVFPALRERLRRHRIHLVDVDLRWGITRQQTENDLAVDACLEQVERCRPFFLGLLGERYGWVPEALSAEALERLRGEPEAYRGLSITEIEMRHGALHQPHLARSLFLLRDAASLDRLPPGLRQGFEEGDPARRERLRRLKQRIRTTAPLVESYGWQADGLRLDRFVSGARLNAAQLARLRQLAPQGALSFDDFARLDAELAEALRTVALVEAEGLRAFGVTTEERLWQMIREEYGLPETPRVEAISATPGNAPGSLEEEVFHHAAFAKSRLQAYEPRRRVHRELLNYVRGDDHAPSLLQGPAGSGKSSCLAHLVAALDQQGPATMTVARYIGAGPRSTELASLLRDICRELAASVALDLELPLDLEALAVTLESLLERTRRSLVMVIDGLDRLADSDRGMDFDWIPAQLPDGVKLIVSHRTNSAGVPGSLAARCSRKIEVDPLSEQERRSVLGRTAALTAKTLDEEQIRGLLANPNTANPLFLRVALQELQVFGRFDHLGDRIAALPRDSDGLRRIFNQVIERLTSEYGEPLVRHTLFLLAASRYGLSEDELRQLLGSIELDRPAENVFLLLRQLRPYLQWHGEFLSFFHDELTAAVEQRVAGSADRRRLHGRLADFFRRQARPRGDRSWREAAGRGLSELPYHLLRAGRWDEAIGLLSDLSFLEAKYRALGGWALLADYRLAESATATGDAASRLGELRWIGEALRLSLHVIAADPAQLRGQICGRLVVHAARHPLIGELLRAARADTTAPSHLIPVTPSLQQAGSALWLTLPPQPRAINAVAVSPDGRWIVAGAGHQVIRVWSFRTGVEMARLRTEPEVTLVGGGHRRSATLHEEIHRRVKTSAVAVSPDSRWVLSATEQGLLSLWDLRGEQRTTVTQVDNQKRIMAIAFFADGRRALSAGFDGQVRVWDLESLETVSVFHCHRGAINDLVLDPERGRFFTASQDRSVALWDLESGEELGRLEGHGDVVWGIALAPDGRRLVSASRDMTLKVWDLERRKLLRTLRGHREVVATVIVALDGRLAISGDRLHQIKIWNLEDGSCLHTLHGHTNWIHSLELSPDGRYLVSCSADATVKVWDLHALSDAESAPQHDSWIHGLAATAGGGLIASAGRDKMLKVWDAEGCELLALPAHADWIHATAFTPDGRRVISAGGGLFHPDFNVKVFELAGGREVHSLAGHGQPVRALAVTPDGRRIISGSKDRTLRIWDASSGEELDRLQCGGDVVDLSVAADGRLAVATKEEIEIWDLELRRRRVSFSGHEGKIRGVAVTPDGRHAVSVSRDQTVRWWPLDDPAAGSILGRHDAAVQGVAVSPSGRVAVSVSNDRTLKVWDLQQGRFSSAFLTDGDLVTCLALDDRTFLAAGSEGRIYRLRLAGRLPEGLGKAATPSGAPDVLSPSDVFRRPRLWARVPTRQHQAEVKSLTGSYFKGMSHHGNMAVSAGYDGRVGVWDVHSAQLRIKSNLNLGRLTAVTHLPFDNGFASASARLSIEVWHCDLDVTARPRGRIHLLRQLEGHRAEIWSLATGRDPRLLVSASSDRTLKVWDLQQDDARMTLTGHREYVNAVVVTGDGRYAISGSGDDTIKIWDLANGRELHTLRGHQATLTALALLPDERYLLSGSWDHTVMLWDLENLEPLATFAGHDQPVSCVSVTPDGHYFLSGSHDGRLCVWEARSGERVEVYKTSTPIYTCLAAGNHDFLVGTVSGDVHFLKWAG